MSSLHFDTLRFSKRLIKAGMEPEQAEALLLVLQESNNTSDLVTKRDLADFKKDIDACFTAVDVRFEKMEAQSDARFEKMEAQSDARFEKMAAQFDGRFEKMAAQFDGRFEKIETQTNTLAERLSALESKLDRFQWLLVVISISILFKEQIVKTLGHLALLLSQ